MKTQTETQTETEVIFYHVHGGVLPQCMLGCHYPPPPGAGTPPEADTPPGAGTPQQTATVADGTHPTGMHYCCLCFSFKFCGR